MLCVLKKSCSNSGWPNRRRPRNRRSNASHPLAVVWSLRLLRQGGGGSRGCIRPRCRGSSFFLLVWPPSNESTWNPPIAIAIATAASSSSFGTARIQYVVLGRRRNRSLLPQPPIRLPQGSYHTSHVPNRLRPPPRQEEEEEDHAVLMLRLRRPFRCSRFVLLLLLLLLVLLWMTMTMILITDATFDVRFSPCFCSREEVLWTMRIVLLLLLLLLRLRRLMWMPIILVGTTEGAELWHNKTRSTYRINTTYLSTTEDGATSTTTSH